ncbi:class A beta-lactamase [Methylobacterium sp. NPDC080182]|uniref:class A beta-lactamase n=1 Tax=Methylobacterium sp. NPDC080182 TaxID=3390590 RepID=UPI003D05D19F
MKSISRRVVIAGSLSAVPFLAQAPTAVASKAQAASISQSLAELERRHKGRICVSIIDHMSDIHIEYRSDERVQMCSTFKVLAVANILHKVDQGNEKLSRRLTFTKGDLVEYSPITSGRVNEPGMTLGEICEAGLGYSDNTSANLMLATLGGPTALTAFCREIGDSVTRLDRLETEMNYPGWPDDLRDTTTAAAMAANLRKLFFTDFLSDLSRAQLASWMIECKTGYTRLRAGLPKYWLIADKTGTNNDKLGNANDVAVAWPNDRPPLVIAAYCEVPDITSEQRNSILAEIGRIASGV